MDQPDATGLVVPKPQICKTIGILNIVFGTILIFYGLCSGISMLMMPYMTRMMETQQKTMEAKVQADFEASQKKRLDEIDVELEAAKTDEERAEIEARKAAVLNRPKPYIPNSMIGLKISSSPEMQAFTWGDVITGELLYIPLLISGIGLIQMREWSRKLSIWVYRIWIVRLVVFVVLGVAVITPMMTTAMDKEFAQMGDQMQQQMGPKGAGVKKTMRQVSRFAGAATGGAYVLQYGVSMLFPGIALYFITRPGARAACLESRPDSEDDMT